MDQSLVPVNRITVGYEQQKTRYIFTEPNEDFIQLSKNIDEPWVFLKVCSSTSAIKNLVAEKWVIQPQGYMMTCFHRMIVPNLPLHDDYKLEFTNHNSTFVVRILTQKDELASIDRVVLVDDFAVYDRILTYDNPIARICNRAHTINRHSISTI